MKVDFFVLHMEGDNMVLGIQWLEELGDVGFNLKKKNPYSNFRGREDALSGKENR